MMRSTHGFTDPTKALLGGQRIGWCGKARDL
jgi:hypothetical protein